jgi:hypothetical protein
VKWLFDAPRVRTAVQASIAAAFLLAVGWEAARYWRSYVRDYPAAAAEDFQYGYRDLVRFMESQRGKYDLFLITANNVNQPQIFTAFYNARPDRIGRPQDEGYLIIDPAEYPRYHMQQRVLAAVRPIDLYLFQDYRIVHRVTTPAGKLEFAIIDAKSRRNFILDWLIVGPFENPDGRGLHIDYVQPEQPNAGAYTSALGKARWRHVRSPFVRINFNVYYEPMLVEAKHQTEWLCAYAQTQVESPSARGAMLELGGPGVPARGWINGRPISNVAMLLQGDLRRWPIELNAGDNTLLLQVCKTGGDWFFTARVTDANGADPPDLKFRPVLPLLSAPAVGPPANPSETAPQPPPAEQPHA